MAVVGITFKGPQGSGKTLLLNEIYSFLSKEGFNLIVFDEIHGINVIDPVETFKSKLKEKEQD